MAEKLTKAELVELLITTFGYLQAVKKNMDVIDEIKGEEALYFITAALTGCNGMTTIHSIDAAGALDKLADYCKWASDYSRKEIFKMLSCVKTVVYVDDFQIKEIAENWGWDDLTGENCMHVVFDREKGVNLL